jgi:hypothetical protein
MFGTVDVQSELGKGTSFIINLQVRAIDQKIEFFKNMEMNVKEKTNFFKAKGFFNYCTNFHSIYSFKMKQMMEESSLQEYIDTLEMVLPRAIITYKFNSISL